MLPARAGAFADHRWPMRTHRLFLSADIVWLYGLSLFIHGLSIATILCSGAGHGAALSPLACLPGHAGDGLGGADCPSRSMAGAFAKGTMVALLAGFGIGQHRSGDLVRGFRPVPASAWAWPAGFLPCFQTGAGMLKPRRDRP